MRCVVRGARDEGARYSVFDLRSSIFDPRFSILDFRFSIFDFRSSTQECLNFFCPKPITGFRKMPTISGIFPFHFMPFQKVRKEVEVGELSGVTVGF